jgi:hypothetical protein
MFYVISSAARLYGSISDKVRSADAILVYYSTLLGSLPLQVISVAVTLRACLINHDHLLIKAFSFRAGRE